MLVHRVCVNVILDAPVVQSMSWIELNNVRLSTSDNDPVSCDRTEQCPRWQSLVILDSITTCAVARDRYV